MQQDPELKRRELEAQDAELDEFTAKIKKLFVEADPRGSGVIQRVALARLFQELDSSWKGEELDQMFSMFGGGSEHIKYGEFVDWFMEEENPKLRRKLWQEMSDAFSSCEADEGDDPEDDDSQADLLENEEALEPLSVDLSERISRPQWRAIVDILDLGDEDGEDMYEQIAVEMRAKGQEDTGSGFPMREYLEELKVEPDDREGVLAFTKALAEAKDAVAKRKTTSAASAKPKNVDKAAVRTMFDKVVRALDKAQAPADSAWQFVSEGRVPMSKAEASAAKTFEGRLPDFVSKVKQYMNSPPLVNATAGQTMCAERCIAEVDAIVQRFRETGTKFTDTDWNVKDGAASVLYVDERGPGYDCTVAPPSKWRRLPDIVKDSGGTSKALGSLFGGFSAGPKPALRPVLFKGGVRAGDIVQGQLGTCFLLGAMGAVAGVREEAIARMFVRHDVDAGVYGVRFNVDGEWTHVVIDDYLAVDDAGQLLYSRCKDPQEAWVPLLEKAFCKLNTCYEMCDGGQPNQAIALMHGGVGGKFVVKKKHRRNPGAYFNVLKQALDKGWFLTTGFVPRGAATASAGKCGEAVLPTGLVGGHAYSVLRAVAAHGHQLICCRNPWGTGEWTGRWSDENENGEWTEEMTKATGHANKDDGKFWMSIDDFVRNTSGVDYARTFGPNWMKLTQHKHFLKRATLGTALYDYSPSEKNEIGFRKGDLIEISTFTGDWWRGNVKGSSKEGFFPGNYVDPKDRPVTCFELVGTPAAPAVPMTAVVMMLQPFAQLKRRWTKRPDGTTYKDLSYPRLQLCIIGPDGSVALKKESPLRCVWGELKLPGGGRWRIYALSTDGHGDIFKVRVYVKDGTASISEVEGAKMEDMLSAI